MNIGRVQLFGCFILFIVSSLLMILTTHTKAPPESPVLDIPFSTERPGAIAVELAGQTGRDGVYFISKGMTSAGFLEMVGLKAFGVPIEPERASLLKTATTITLTSAPPCITIGPMAAGKRLALGIPIDINRSSMQDLVLIPGIGEKTAEKILELRRENGMFRKLDELMLVKGIKEKRFEKLRRYLCIDC